jgi:arginine decarboxylase
VKSAFVPSKVFLTRGRGRHKEKLVSFERALREAGIAPFNLVRVSSIFPPHARLVSREAGLKLLRPGQIVFVVLSENATDEPRRLISASIGLAIPEDPSGYGYLAEHEDFGRSEKEAGLFTEYLAAEMLATKMGERLSGPAAGRRSYRFSNGLALKTRSLSQAAAGEAEAWTTVLAAAVLVMEG